MRVALVHYWLVSMRGGEKVLEALCELYPEADIFTHVYDPEALSPTLRRHRITTTFINRLPRAARWYQRYLPLMPLALEQLDLRGYDLVISSESGPAKGVITSSDALHLCYCHTPMRYVWDMYHDYLEGAGRLTRLVMPPVMHYLRLWDLATAARVDHFVANSGFVAGRIGATYRREADVIHPPVETQDFEISEERGDFYLMLGQLVPYKRTDLALDAFAQLERKLVVIGDGSELDKLRRRAGANITFLGRQPFDVIRDHYARCRALIFPGLEDFGIVPVEAMASGRPVIAYGRGGALETVVDGETGIFFDAQTGDALVDAVRRFEAREDGFDPAQIAAHARQFDRAVFKQKMKETIDRLLAARAD